jgi:hypothetical protein
MTSGRRRSERDCRKREWRIDVIKVSIRTGPACGPPKGNARLGRNIAFDFYRYDIN